MKKYFSPIFIIVAIFFFSPSPLTVKVAYAAPDDYVSCWDLEETSGSRADANTTNGNDLDDNATVTSATGKDGTAASFDSANSEYLNIDDANQTGLDYTSDFSFSGWYYLDSDFSSAGGAFWYKWGGGQAAYGMIYRDVSTVNNVTFIGYETGGGSNINHDWEFSLSTGTWYHVVLTYDQSTENAELWIDNSSQGTRNSGYSGSSNTTGAFSLSSLGDGIQWYWDGRMDIVETYDRVLTDTEIGDLYNSGNGVGCTARAAEEPITPPPLFLIN